MPIDTPRSRGVRGLNAIKRNVPVDQIIAIEGYNPLAVGIEQAGTTIGQTLLKRAQLRKQGEDTARAMQIAGVDSSTMDLTGLDTDLALKALSVRQTMQNKDNETYNPAQVKAVYGGKADDIVAAFPKGVPKDVLDKAFSAQRITNLEDERNVRDDDRLGAAALNYWKTLETNPVIKTLKQQDIGLGQVDQLVPLVKSGNTVASNALGAKMARGMGEVGVLTDTDIVRYVQSGQITRSAADKLSRMTKGVPTDATIQEMQQITFALRDAYEAKIQPLYNDAVVRFAKNYKLSPEQAAERLVIPYTGKPSLKPLPGAKKATHRWNPQTGQVEVVQ